MVSVYSLSGLHTFINKLALVDLESDKWDRSNFFDLTSKGLVSFRAFTISNFKCLCKTLLSHKDQCFLICFLCISECKQCKSLTAL